MRFSITSCVVYQSFLFPHEFSPIVILVADMKIIMYVLFTTDQFLKKLV
jgi:hypothetical protein